VNESHENEDGSWTVTFDPPLIAGRNPWWLRVWRKLHGLDPEGIHR